MSEPVASSASTARRARAARLASLSGLAARVITVGASFVAIPLVQRALGPEMFGVWVTIASLLAFLSFADLGVGNGVMNAVSRAFGHGDHDAVRRISSSAAATMILLGLGMAVLGVLAVWGFGGERLVKLQSTAQSHEVRDALLIFVVVMGVNIAIGWIAKLQMGLQRGYLDAIAQALGGVFTVAGVLLAMHVHPYLGAFVLASVGGPVLAAALVGLGFIVFGEGQVRPRLGLVDVTTARNLVRTGGLFFILQVAGAIGFASDNLVLAGQLGATEAGDYAIVSKLFTPVTILVGLYVAPLWPAYAEAHARGDGPWIVRTLRRSLLLSVAAACVLVTVIGLAYEPLTRLWLGRPHAVSAGLLALVAAWTVFMAAGQALAVFLNGMEIVRPQIVCSLSFALIGLVLKWFWVIPLGVVAIPLVGLLVYALTHLVPYFFYIRGKLISLHPSPVRLVAQGGQE